MVGRGGTQHIFSFCQFSPDTHIIENLELLIYLKGPCGQWVAGSPLQAALGIRPLGLRVNQVVAPQAIDLRSGSERTFEYKEPNTGGIQAYARWGFGPTRSSHPWPQTYGRRVSVRSGRAYRGRTPLIRPFPQPR